MFYKGAACKVRFLASKLAEVASPVTRYISGASKSVPAESKLSFENESKENLIAVLELLSAIIAALTVPSSFRSGGVAVEHNSDVMELDSDA